jgi:hypothetical protein
MYSSRAFRGLEIVYSSELGDNGISMSDTNPSQAEWLRAQAHFFLQAQDAFILTQMLNIAAAFPQDATSLRDGEALIYKTDNDGPHLIARIQIEDWPKLQP